MKAQQYKIDNGVEFQKCNVCEKWKFISDFHRDKSKKRGFRYKCKVCTKKYDVDYLKRNREKRSKQHREWRINNRDRHNELNSRWRNNNLEKARASGRKCYHKHKDERRLWSIEYYIKNKNNIRPKKKKWKIENFGKVKKTSAIYYQKNKERHKKWMKEYYKNNKDKYRESARKYYNTPKGRTSLNISRRIAFTLKGKKGGRHWEDIVGYSVEQLIFRLKKTMPKGYTWDDYLNGELHIDHKIPIAVFNYETPDDLDFKKCWALKNLQLLPAGKNLSKGAKIDRPFQPSLLLRAQF